MIHTVKGFSIVSDAEVDVFLESSCFFYDPMDVGNLISGSPAFLKPAWTSGSSWFTYCWSLAWRIFFSFIIIIIFFFFTLQYCIGFAIHQHASARGVHLFPILNAPSHLPPHSISLGHPSAPAPSILYHASNLDWRFVLIKSILSTYIHGGDTI